MDSLLPLKRRAGLVDPWLAKRLAGPGRGLLERKNLRVFFLVHYSKPFSKRIISSP